MIYFGREFHSTQTGDRLVGVACEKCECEYLYELARVGSGSGNAPYMIGIEEAAGRARNESIRDLAERLALEAELVPCPRCHWINEALVEGYRRGRYRRWGRAAAWIAGVGTIASMFSSWYIAQGPAADHGAWPYVLILGPIVSVALAMVPLLVRRGLRGRIRPNRYYPALPTLPRGTPLALIEHPASGALVPQSSSREQPEEWIDFKIGRDRFPDACCVCLGPPSPKASYPRFMDVGVEMKIPLCPPCARGRKWRVRRIGLSITVLTLAAGCTILALSTSDEAVFWLLFGGLACIAPGIGFLIAARIADPYRFKLADSDRGIVPLWFRNAAFPRMIAEARAESGESDAPPDET